MTPRPNDEIEKPAAEDSARPRLLPVEDRWVAIIFTSTLASTLLVPQFEFVVGLQWCAGVSFPTTDRSLSNDLIIQLLIGAFYSFGFICAHWVASYVLSRIAAQWIDRRMRTSIATLFGVAAITAIVAQLVRSVGAPLSLALFFTVSTFGLIGSIFSWANIGGIRLNLSWRIVAIFAFFTTGIALAAGPPN